MQQPLFSDHPLFYITENDLYFRSVIVMNDVTSMPNTGKSYVSPYGIMSICESGSVSVEYDARPIVFQRHDISLLPPGHVVKSLSASPDYRVRLMVFTPAFVEHFQQYLQQMSQQQAFDHEHPSFHLTEEQVRQMNILFDQVQMVSEGRFHHREELLDSIAYTIFTLIDEFHPMKNDTRQLDNQRIFPRFVDALISHFRESREVQFYADIFHFTPKYFSSLIAKETGNSAGEWINRYVTTQAKTLLVSSKNMTVQQIADHLGFSEHAAFCRFFKQNTGVTPSEYRQ